MAAKRASLSALSLSVFRLTLDHFQASSLVEQTSVWSPGLFARSLIQPEGPRLTSPASRFYAFEAVGEVVAIGRGVEKYVLPSFGVEKGSTWY